MLDETTTRFFITGITKENEQSVINKLERSGFSNWWLLPEAMADYIYVSKTWNNQYVRMSGTISDLFNAPRIIAEGYLCEDLSK